MSLRIPHPARSVRAKFFFLHASILLPFLMLGIIWVANAAGNERTRAITQLDERAHRVADSIGAVTREKMAVIRTIGELPSVEAGRSPEIGQILASMLSHHPLVNNLFIVDAAGVRIASAIQGVGEQEYMGDSELFREVMRAGQPSVSSARIATEGRAIGQPVILFAVLLRDQAGKPTGTLVAEIILSEIQNLVMPAPESSGGYVFVVDRAGQVIAHSNVEVARTLRDFSGVEAVRDLMAGEEETSEFVDPIQNVRVTAVYRRIPAAGWGVVSAQRADLIEQTMARTGFGISAIFATSLIFALSAAYVVGNRLADRIAALTSAASEISAGQVGRQVEFAGEDEIGSIGRSLNTISDQICDQRMRLEDNSRVLESACQSVGEALAGSSDVDEAVRLAMLSSARLTGVENAVGLVAEDEEHLRVVQSLGRIPPQVMGKLWPLDQRLSVLGQVLRQCQPQQVRDVQTHEGPPDAVVILGRELGFRTALVVPLASFGRCLGVMVLFDTRSPRLFTREELARVQKIASEAAIAIDTSRFQQQTKAANEQLILAGLRLRTIIETIPDGVVVAEAPSGRITIFNSAAEWLLGQKITSEADLHEQPRFYRLYHAEEKLFKDEELPLFRSIVFGEKDTKQIVVKRPAGKTLTILFGSAPLRDERGTIIGAVGVFSDVSEMKELDRLKDEFLYVTTHEVKSPLTVVRGYTQLLLRNVVGKPGHEEEVKWLQAIADQSGRLTALVERLLDVSRIQTGKLELARSRTDIVALTRKVAEQEQVTTNAHEIRAHPELSELVGHWDQARLEQVLINLVDNAIKYSPHGGSIDIYIRRLADEAQVAVEDRGIGIAKDDLRRIFEKFYRAQAGKERPSGLGLGLYISYQIVTLHGGRMWAESEPGKGSTFYFTLPLNHHRPGPN